MEKMASGHLRRWQISTPYSLRLAKVRVFVLSGKLLSSVFQNDGGNSTSFQNGAGIDNLFLGIMVKVLSDLGTQSL